MATTLPPTETAQSSTIDLGTRFPGIDTADTRPNYKGRIIPKEKLVEVATGKTAHEGKLFERRDIGYQPANPTMDGKYRRIDVKTKLAGLNVRARKGYAAVALPPQESLMGGGR